LTSQVASGLRWNGLDDHLHQIFDERAGSGPLPATLRHVFVATQM
jgi:hypothetical protein